MTITPQAIVVSAMAALALRIWLGSLGRNK